MIKALCDILCSWTNKILHFHICQFVSFFPLNCLCGGAPVWACKHTCLLVIEWKCSITPKISFHQSIIGLFNESVSYDLTNIDTAPLGDETSSSSRCTNKLQLIMVVKCLRRGDDEWAHTSIILRPTAEPVQGTSKPGQRWGPPKCWGPSKNTWQPMKAGFFFRLNINLWY